MTLTSDSLADAIHESQDGLGRANVPSDYYAGLDLPTAEDEAAGVEGPWRIDGDRMAAWALRRIAEHQTEVDRLQQAAQADIDAVQAWLADATRGPKGSIAYLEAALIDYRRRLETDNPKLPKTYKLPGGDLTRRAGRISFVVADEDALIDWAETHDPTLLRRRAVVTPLKGSGYEIVVSVDEPVGRVVTADGEVVPGVEVPAPADTYAVKVRAETSPVERAS